MGPPGRAPLEIIAYEILPAGTPQTLKLFPQNLVRDDGVLAQILNRETDVLSRRTVVGSDDGEPRRGRLPAGLLGRPRPQPRR